MVRLAGVGKDTVLRSGVLGVILNTSMDKQLGKVRIDVAPEKSAT